MRRATPSPGGPQTAPARKREREPVRTGATAYPLTRTCARTPPEGGRRARSGRLRGTSGVGTVNSRVLATRFETRASAASMLGVVGVARVGLGGRARSARRRRRRPPWRTTAGRLPKRRWAGDDLGLGQIRNPADVGDQLVVGASTAVRKTAGPPLTAGSASRWFEGRCGSGRRKRQARS